MSDVTIAELEATLTPALAALGYEWWGGVWKREGRQSLLRVYIDKPGGVNVDDCARASHQISGALAVNDPIHGEYTLEVSSPGLDRPLFKPAQYQRFMGCAVKLKLRLPHLGQRNFQGTLQQVDQEQLTLQCDGNEVVLRFENVERANLVPDFS